MGKQVRHRGPDWSGNHTANNTILVHERLSIVGVDTGAQPMISDDGSIALAVNGEIYNHKILRKQLKNPYPFKTHSDCEVIIPLYKEHGIDAPKHLDGMFSWVLHDKAQDRLIAARDPIGITTFYMGRSSKEPDTVYFASELKCLHPVCDSIQGFPPGHVYDSKTDQLTRYFTPQWLMEPSKVPSSPLDLTVLRETLERSVRKRMMAEVPYGVLLSGGLDSSLVASIAQRETLRLQKEYAKQQAFLNSGVNTPQVNGQANGQIPVPNGNGSPVQEDLAGIDEDYTLHSVPVLSQLNSFSIGLPGAPDSVAAAEVAKFLGTRHHAFTFTIQEGLDALFDVIFHLETYDVTTIRASTPMFLLSRKIKAMGVKMVLSGEGSDEVFGGYLYFHAAPDKKAFHEETVRRVKNLHLADCLRANKSTSAWGVEARVPFLDKEFLDVAMNIDPAEKMITKERIEKWAIRSAFSSDNLPPGTKPYLPDRILWRQKEQFSDGVGYGWIDGLKDEAKKMVSDEQMVLENMKRDKPHWGDDVPDSKEAYWYRCMFDEHFPPQCAETVMRWTPTWSKQTDPSGRAIATHDQAYKEGQGQ